jgi:hypothetical protein
MDTSEFFLEHKPPAAAGGWLYLGGGHAVSEEDIRRATAHGHAALVLLGPVSAAEVAAILDRLPDPALPVADYAGNRGLRSDYQGAAFDAGSVPELQWRFAPIWRRLDEIPFHAAREDRDQIAILRLAYSRGTEIEARFAPESQLLVTYPLLGEGGSMRQRLEALASGHFLRRRHFTRTHICNKCHSARLHVYEACPSCSSSDLHDEAIVHHYRCGWQDAESKFIQNNKLICPKCRHELKHLGVDYGKPGTMTVCRACGAVNAEPNIEFVCLDCGVTMAADAAETMDWFHYDITAEGLRALRESKLPHFTFAQVLANRSTRALSWREFRLLAAEGLRIAKRYDRPFAVARLTVRNAEELRAKVGSVSLEAAFGIMVDAIIETLRESDFVGTNGPMSVVIGFPETPAREVGAIVARLLKRITMSVNIPLDIASDIAEGDPVGQLLGDH